MDAPPRTEMRGAGRWWLRPRMLERTQLYRPPGPGPSPRIPHKCTEYLLCDRAWGYRGFTDEDTEGQGQETTRSFSQLVNSKANLEPGP